MESDDVSTLSVDLAHLSDFDSSVADVVVGPCALGSRALRRASCSRLTGLRCKAAGSWSCAGRALLPRWLPQAAARVQVDSHYRVDPYLRKALQNFLARRGPPPALPAVQLRGGPAGQLARHTWPRSPDTSALGAAGNGPGRPLVRRQ